MKTKSILVLIAMVAQFASANEYDTRARESYQASQQANAATSMASLVRGALAMKSIVLAFAQKHGGLADAGECKVGVSYSCDGSLCTPRGSATLPVSALGTTEGAAFECKVKLGDNLACLVDSGGYHSGYYWGANCFDGHGKERFIKIR